MSLDKKEYELFLELLLLAERYSPSEIQKLKFKLKNLTLDEKIADLFDTIVYLKGVRIKEPSIKYSPPKSAKYESKVLSELKRSDPEKYANLKPIEDALIKDENNIKFASIKELVLELGGDKKDTRSRRYAIIFLMKMLSKMTKEEIEKYVKNLYLERKEGRLGNFADLIMGESNTKTQ